MSDLAAFTGALADWSSFFGYIGTTAATLLGLLFVAVSLRLEIFERDDVADVRDFARLTLISFLTAVIISGVTLMPHERQPLLSAILAVFGLVGVLLLTLLWIERSRLQPGPERAREGPFRSVAQIGTYMALIILGYGGLVLAAAVLWWNASLAFLVLGASLVLLLGTGTVNAWLVLSNAGRSASTKG